MVTGISSTSKDQSSINVYQRKVTFNNDIT